MIRAAIISTGDELTCGRTTDTNAGFIADRLFELGIDVVAMLTVGDHPERLRWVWSEALRLAQVVISTGGLGPTADDLTTETVATLLARRIVHDEQVAERIREFFRLFNRPMPENNMKQAAFPEGAVIVPNDLGTAPGYRIEVGPADDRRYLVVLPGVPREMQPMLTATVLPWLAELSGAARVGHRTFQTFGISESRLDEVIAGIPGEGRWSFRANFPEVSARVVVRGGDVEARLEDFGREVYARLGQYIYGEGDTSMERVVGELLTARKLTVGFGESCTGGLVTHRITNVPGCSAYYRGAVNAYANDVKERVLGVPAAILAAHGAVSEEVAGAMAEGARRVLGTDIAVGVTGIAGPDGGTAEKPVGTVCFGLAAADGPTVTRRYQLWGNREWVKLLSSQIALDWVRRHVLGAPLLDLGRNRAEPASVKTESVEPD
ncbi:MAG: competence/damage-inducible protein A [Polyangiaceae bacterium UTPRO1]|jgi:nicotinamide-nucleotide amidase|nr:competence/damage-inducible protein A [Myxococcales bacterium]OQY65374.1 MAG: competence/damage-inducible protein A [Polyangiaceae bacterium UTPRO1]